MSEQPKGQSEGREKNAASADYPEVSEVTPQAYPSAGKDDTVEPRSFDNRTGNPDPPQGAGDTSVPPATNEGRTGPQGDPAEGKR
jgi:hypothetical protein